MKTLLIPTLALFALPLFAQEIAAPGAGSSPPPPTAPGRANNPTPAPARPEEKTTEATPATYNCVQFETATLKKVIEVLNSFLESQHAPRPNVVLTPEAENVSVPGMTLQNVSVNDVLNVIAKVTGLSVEPVSADSGKVAAWVIAPWKRGYGAAGMSLAGMMGGFGGGVAGGGGGGGGVGQPTELGVEAAPPIPAPPLPTEAPVVGQPPRAALGTNNFVGSYTRAGGAGSIGNGGGSMMWVDPAGGAGSPPQINRVIGIARIYGDVTNEKDRAEKETMLVKMLDDITEVQKLTCEVRLYGELHILVVKGSPEAVELVEQTVAALKENSGVKKSESVGGKFNSGIGIKN